MLTWKSTCIRRAATREVELRFNRGDGTGDKNPIRGPVHRDLVALRMAQADRQISG